MSNDKSSTPWRRIKLIAAVIEIRLRFILVLAATALLVGYWPTIKNYWDKFTRPAAAAAGRLPADKEFYCPMDPKVIRSGYEPDGSVPKCPICGMPLSLRSKGQSEPLPPGVTGRVQLSPDRIRMAGIETAEVGYRPMSKELTTVAAVTYNESRLARVVSRVSGYVEKLYVDKTFVEVRQGDPLAAIYSPDLYTTAQELLLAGKAGGGDDLAASARRRLQLLGVGERDIEALVSAGVAKPRLMLRSPRSGRVIRKNVVEGSRVEDGMTLLEVADLSSVWIEADVFEQDVGMLHEGQRVEALVAALPGRTFTGKVALVYPQMDAATRTNRVRFQVANPDAELRPGMFATVRIETPLSQIEPFRSVLARAQSAKPASGESALPFRLAPGGPGQPTIEEWLSVPERAVVDTGTQQIVYVERKPGEFDGHEVVLGPRSGQFYPVAEGLLPGQRVAAAGAFLIDAETRLNPAAASAYFGASGGPSAGPAAGNTAAPAPVKPAAQSAPAPADQQSPARGPAAVPIPNPQSPITSSEPQPPAGEALDNINRLGPADRTAALAQRTCPITGVPLGTMGVPVKVTIKGQAVFLCCAGCTAAATNNPDETLAKVAKLKAAKGKP